MIIPVFNGADTLQRCLRALFDSRCPPDECIVIDDGSTDNSVTISRLFNATVLSTGGRFGPSKARNLGAREAQGDILLFIDSDVELHIDALRRIVDHFESDPALDALIGSYDDAPGDPGFVSQFKNLMHAFVHHQGNNQASTFWCGCGAVRRAVYLAHGGLDESYAKPSIEDIELGYRMRAAGRKLLLDPQVLCKHLKTWTLGNLIRTDIFQRGIPWTQLILRSKSLPNDLNLKQSQRLSVVLAGLVILFPLFGWYWAALLCLFAVLIINVDFYQFLVSRKGAAFAMAAVPLHLLYFLYSGFSFGIGVALHLLTKAGSGLTS